MSVQAAAVGIISAAAVCCANWETAAERVWQRCLELKQQWQQAPSCCFLIHTRRLLFCLWYVFFYTLRLMIVSYCQLCPRLRLVTFIREHCRRQFYVVDLLVHGHLSPVANDDSSCSITVNCCQFAQCDNSYQQRIFDSSCRDWHGLTTLGSF